MRKPLSQKKDSKKYVGRFSDCYKRKCLVPYSGNGRMICRLYELGQCKNGK
jgi:hypothetical protein